MFSPVAALWLTSQYPAALAVSEDWQGTDRQALQKAWLGNSLLLEIVQTLLSLINGPYSNGVCGVKWRHFYNKIENKQDIVTDIELIFGQLITDDKMKLV